MTARTHIQGTSKVSLRDRRIENGREATFKLISLLRLSYPFWIAGELRALHRLSDGLQDRQDMLLAWKQFQERLSDAVLEKLVVRAKSATHVAVLMNRSEWISNRIHLGKVPAAAAEAIEVYYYELAKLLINELPKHFNQGEIMRMLNDYFYLQSKENFEVHYSVLNELDEDAEGPVDRLIDWFRKNWTLGEDRELLGSGA